MAEQNFVLAELNIFRALEGRRHYCRTLYMAEGITAELRRLKPDIAFCRTHLFCAATVVLCAAGQNMALPYRDDFAPCIAEQKTSFAEHTYLSED